MSGGRFLTSSQFLRVVRPVSLSNLQHIIYYITWLNSFLNLPLELFFSVVVQNYHSRFGFTEMSTMLKICMACILLFLFTYAHGVYRVSEKSISLYPPIRIYVSFRIDIWWTSGVRILSVWLFLKSLSHRNMYAYISLVSICAYVFPICEKL